VSFVIFTACSSQQQMKINAEQMFAVSIGKNSPIYKVLPNTWYFIILYLFIGH